MNQKEINLSDECINSTVEEIKAFFLSRKVSEKEVLKLGLSIEEILLRLRDKFGKEQTAILETSRFMSTKILIRLKGERFNPILEDEDSILNSEYLQNLLNDDSNSTTYRYRNGYNEIFVAAVKGQRKFKLPGGAITIAFLLAVCAGVITKHLSAETASFLVNQLAAPLFSRLMSLIVLAVGPLILVSVVSGICALNDVATLSSIGLKTIRRFVSLTLLLTTLSTAVGILFFPGIAWSPNGAFDFSVVYDMLLELIPRDFVSPFVEGKTIQIIIIATAIGIAFLILDEKTPNLRGLVSEVNKLIFTIMKFVSKIIPLAVFLSIYKAISQNTLSNILSVWKLVVSGYAAMVPFTVGHVLFVCIKRKINVITFLRNIFRPTAVAFSTASGTLSMTEQFDTARNVMKKDEKFIDFWIPLCHALFSPSVIPPLVTAVFFVGNYYGTPISVPQILIMYILLTQLSVASPKVPGGIMATFTILLSQLGLPTDIVGLLMVANVFLVNAMTGAAMVIRLAEMEEFSHVIEEKNLGKAKQ